MTVPVFEVPDLGPPKLSKTHIGKNGTLFFFASLPTLGFFSCHLAMTSCEKANAAAWIL